MDHDTELLIRSEMLTMIEGVPADLVERHPLQFLMHVDHIRQAALKYKLNALSNLCSACETALHHAMKNGSGTTTARYYLAAMHDALGCKPMDDEQTESLMASVAVRLGG